MEKEYVESMRERERERERERGYHMPLINTRGAGLPPRANRPGAWPGVPLSERTMLFLTASTSEN